MDLSKLKKLGAFPVRLEGEIHTAPFSKRSCYWFEWIKCNEPPYDKGYSFGYGSDHENPITTRSKNGDLTVYPDRIMLYLAPSFEGKAVVDGEEQHITEFCLDPDHTYYGFSEKLVCHLPPFRFFPFFPRRKTIWLLALSDEPFKNGRPLQPLIPTRQGMTG